jgi:hypothetical protein
MHLILCNINRIYSWDLTSIYKYIEKKEKKVFSKPAVFL